MCKKIVFKGIVFKNIVIENFSKITDISGLYLFPSAPGISSIEFAKSYYNSLKKADFVFFDSGFFVILLKIFKNISVKRFSGYKFIKLFLEYLKNNKNISIFLVDPSHEISRANRNYLIKNGHNKSSINNYIAPYYNTSKLNDEKLIKKLNLIKPKIILINLGGGTQEVLGYYLKKKLKFKTKIFCTGAALSFFTGKQAPINDFIDKFYLGWFIRLVLNPKLYFYKQLTSLKLVSMVKNNEINIVK
tara:strand:+ start:789 stop:1526 length:738 start_codon:yes stop_codon:yes gene_type:complete